MNSDLDILTSKLIKIKINEIPLEKGSKLLSPVILQSRYQRKSNKIIYHKTPFKLIKRSSGAKLHIIHNQLDEKGIYSWLKNSIKNYLVDSIHVGDLIKNEDRMYILHKTHVERIYDVIPKGFSLPYYPSDYWDINDLDFYLHVDVKCICESLDELCASKVLVDDHYSVSDNSYSLELDLNQPIFNLTFLICGLETLDQTPAVIYHRINQKNLQDFINQLRKSESIIVRSSKGCSEVTVKNIEEVEFTCRTPFEVLSIVRY